MVYLVIVLLFLAALSPAHAYVDPGSGSYMIQMMMAAALAVVFTIKMTWQRIKAFAAGLFSRSSQTGKSDSV